MIDATGATLALVIGLMLAGFAVLQTRRTRSSTGWDLVRGEVVESAVGPGPESAVEIRVRFRRNGAEHIAAFTLADAPLDNEQIALIPHRYWRGRRILLQCPPGRVWPARLALTGQLGDAPYRRWLPWLGAGGAALAMVAGLYLVVGMLG